MTGTKIYWECRLPNRRRSWNGELEDTPERLIERLQGPGMWTNDDVVRVSPLVVTWSETLPADYDLTVMQHVAETLSWIGYSGSDTCGPDSRKAHARYHTGDANLASPWYTCPGSW